MKVSNPKTQAYSFWVDVEKPMEHILITDLLKRAQDVSVLLYPEDEYLQDRFKGMLEVINNAIKDAIE